MTDPWQIDIDDIAHLATPVGTIGAIRGGESCADDLFDYIVGIAVVVHSH